ncbi:TPA: LPS export ABC transporter periplasmic protein LptC, partial [Campylobacter fetus]|nr:LPS export ABC transporter periplasmic protein LptC [Campylobacter fetus]
MDEALVIKIFYFVIALFSVSMVFLMLQTPYSANIYKNELKVANMQASNVVSYELNSTLVYGRYEASDVTRYETYDLLNSFSGLFLRGDYTHSLSSKLAIL